MRKGIVLAAFALACTGLIAKPQIDRLTERYNRMTYEDVVPYSDMAIDIPVCLTDREEFEFVSNSRYLPAGEEWLTQYDFSMEELNITVAERDPECAARTSRMIASNKAAALHAQNG